MEVSLNYCSQNGGNVYRAPYYNGNPNIGPRIMGNLDQSPNNNKHFLREQCVKKAVEMSANAMDQPRAMASTSIRRMKLYWRTMC